MSGASDGVAGSETHRLRGAVWERCWMLTGRRLLRVAVSWLLWVAVAGLLLLWVAEARLWLRSSVAREPRLPMCVGAVGLLPCKHSTRWIFSLAREACAPAKQQGLDCTTVSCFSAASRPSQSWQLETQISAKLG